MTRYSREFLAAHVPLTPELERLHDLDTQRVPMLPAVLDPDVRVTRRLPRKQSRKRVRVSSTLIVLSFGVLGAVVGTLVAMVLS